MPPFIVVETPWQCPECGTARLEPATSAFGVYRIVEPQGLGNAETCSGCGGLLYDLAVGRDPVRRRTQCPDDDCGQMVWDLDIHLAWHRDHPTLGT